MFRSTITLSALATLLVASSAHAIDIPTDFAALDTNSDGQVSFAEYKTYAKTHGASDTLAAQHFTKISAGDAVITEDELFTAYALQGTDAAYAPILTSAPAEAAPLVMEAQPVEPAPSVTYAPVVEDTVPVESYETPMESPPIETAPVEMAPAETTPVETPPVEPTPDSTIEPMIDAQPVEDVSGEVIVAPDVDTPAPAEIIGTDLIEPGASPDSELDPVETAIDAMDGGDDAAETVDDPDFDETPIED